MRGYNPPDVYRALRELVKASEELQALIAELQRDSKRRIERAIKKAKNALEGK